jgi:hypothetical protein
MVGEGLLYMKQSRAGKACACATQKKKMFIIIKVVLHIIYKPGNCKKCIGMSFSKLLFLMYLNIVHILIYNIDLSEWMNYNFGFNFVNFISYVLRGLNVWYIYVYFVL